MSTAACTITAETFSKKSTFAFQMALETAVYHASSTSTKLRGQTSLQETPNRPSSTSNFPGYMSMAAYGIGTRMAKPFGAKTMSCPTLGISGKPAVLRTLMFGSRLSLILIWTCSRPYQFCCLPFMLARHGTTGPTGLWSLVVKIHCAEHDLEPSTVHFAEPTRRRLHHIPEHSTSSIIVQGA